MVDYRKLKAIESKNKKRWLNLDPTIPDASGIYILVRKEDGFKYAYVGQAKHILTRLAQHLSGYQHIDLSLKKHGLWSAENQCGWTIASYERCGENDLDDMEKYFIKKYAGSGYQLRNKTSGGQGDGKSGINENKPSKGYYDGKKQGYKDAQKFVANLIEKYLDVTIRGKETVNAKKALEKFNNFINPEEE